MTPILYHQILERLTEDAALDATVVTLVDAACRGPAALERELSDLSESVPPPSRRASARPPADPPGATLSRIEVGGFRGIGPATALDLTPGPGLTLLIGRNGSGKSTFAEGLETLLTGESARWASRGREWRDGWRNLHESDISFVETTFYVEGSDPIVVRRSWRVGEDLSAGEMRVRRGAAKLDGLDALGWQDALRIHRPFLSYADLGAVLAEPSRLHDQLATILGLGDINQAIDLLSRARKEREVRAKDAKRELEPLLADLRGLDDDRARACVVALERKPPDLDAVDRIIGASPADTSEDDALAALGRLAQLAPPSLEVVSQSTETLRAAQQAHAAVVASQDAERLAEAADLEGLLGAAIAFVERHAPDQCPVCEGRLDTGWAAAAHARLERAKLRAGELSAATDALTRAMRAVRQSVPPPPQILRSAEGLGLPRSALDTWQRWSALPDGDAVALCTHVDTHVLDVIESATALRTAAAERLAAMESAWRPLARRIAAWLILAHRAAAEREVLRSLKAAEKWLKDAEQSLRADRFAPIAREAQSIWQRLRQNSNVDVTRVALEGRGNRRRVALGVTVDGTDGVALGVMSQGELNALALSLFLPRTMLPDSPFHFVVIDDPVQAMDPHKVDGLARVLEEVARVRQVIVLTHDTRLDEAIRRLGITATILEVDRRARSVVALRPALDPVARHLADARACMHHEQHIGPRMAARTVPGFCRLAVEAACAETIRRRRLSRGDRHADVEHAIGAARGLQSLAALAVHDDADRTDTLYSHLNATLGRWSVNTLKALKDGAHAAHAGPLGELIDSTKSLTRELRSLS